MNPLAHVHRLASGHVLAATVTCTCGQTFVGESYPDAVVAHVEHALAEYARPQRVNA